MDNNGISVREWREEDFFQTENIIKTTWWDGPISDETGNRISTAMLCECLKNQTFTRVAEKDGKLLGAIMARDNRHPSTTLRERYHFFASIVSLLMDKEARRLAIEADNESEVHRSLIAQAGNRKYDGEISFFIVSEDARGKGVGRALFESLLEYFEEAGIKTWNVYTDTDCSYGFYEHEGAVRRGSVHKDYRMPDGSKGEITYFLYDYGF